MKHKPNFDKWVIRDIDKDDAIGSPEGYTLEFPSEDYTFIHKLKFFYDCHEELVNVCRKVVNNWGNLHPKDRQQLRRAIANASKIVEADRGVEGLGKSHPAFIASEPITFKVK